MLGPDSRLGAFEVGDMSSDSNRECSKDRDLPSNHREFEVARTFKYTRWLLLILGVWPMVKKNPRKFETHASKILIAISLILMVFILIPCTLHMIFIEKNPTVRIMLFGPIGFFLTNILKYCSIIFRRDVIKRCMEHVEVDWMRIEIEDDRKIMKRNTDTGHDLTVICGIFMYTGGLSYHTIMPILRGSVTNEFNETVRPLVYPGYDIFVNPQISPNYEIIFYTNCISACVTYAVTTTSCNLAAILVTHACGQIEIMMARLENLFEGNDASNGILEKRVNFVIESHVRVLRLTAMIEKVLREICLVEVVASTLMICLLEYYCMTEWHNSETVAILTYFVLLMSLSFNIFIFCHIGELLKEQCSQVGKAAYMMDWYRLPGKTGLSLVMIIAMANYPRKLTAGRMIELSISSFGAVIKTSVMYLNMLRTVAG